jgi:hypothetical protein
VEEFAPDDHMTHFLFGIYCDGVNIPDYNIYIYIYNIDIPLNCEWSIGNDLEVTGHGLIGI